MKKIYSLLSAFLIVGASFAQFINQNSIYDFTPESKYSGAITTTSANKVKQNQDRTVYHTQNFDAGLNGWNSDIQAGAGGFQGFKITNVGHDNTSTYIIPDIATSTPTNWIVLDSDGDAGGSYGTPEASTLNSPRIDLTATLGSYVALEFDQFFAEWDQAIYTQSSSSEHCYIAVSTDSIAWTEFEINDLVGRDGRPNPEHISWDISDAIAPNLDSVWFRFRWAGAWNYGWQIDNVSVVDINSNDLTIVGTYRNLSPDGLMYSQVPEAHASEFVVGLIFINTGHFDQTGITFDYVLKDPANAVVASGTVGTVDLSNAVQDTMFVATGFTPTDLGTYTVEWTLASVEGDVDISDNTASDNFFELTEFTFAKDYNQGPVVEFSNWDSFSGEAYFGNTFTFEQTDVVSALEVNITNYPSNIGETIFTSVWVFYDGATEWVEYVANGPDYVITASDLGQMITIPFASGVDVDPLDVYCFQIGQYATPVQPLFARQGDMWMSSVQGFDDVLDPKGFPDRFAPIVRIRVNANEVGIENNQLTEVFSVYPNPANDIINVSLTLNESSNTTVNVLDITGKIIKTIYVGEVNGDKNLSISLDEMSSGIYFIELVNAEGRQVQKFVKK